MSSTTSKSPRTTKKSVEEIYQKKSAIEHIKDLPDTYIGSVENTETNSWIYNDNDKIINKKINYIPGLYKIYDEIIVNALDHSTRLNCNDTEKHKVSIIKVNIDKDTNTISVYNNGEGIPIVIHKDHKIYIPEMIFGNLLTSANYDKTEKKITGGKNGYGSKLTNIFSTEFIVETVDSSRKLKYKQVFQNNMDIKSKPTIRKFSGNPFTKITFKPDLKVFGIDKLTDDIVSLMKKRVLDVSVCVSNKVKVYLNDKLINCKTLEQYIKYYFNEPVEYIYTSLSDRWEAIIAVHPETKFEQVSFVNGINTTNGGKHVDQVVNTVCRKIQAHISKHGYKRKKSLKIKQTYLKDNMFVFVRSIIENPSFDSQIKEFLTTPYSKFGSKFEIDDKTIAKLMKTSLIDRAIKLNEFKDTISITKTVNKKCSTIRGIPKLDDAIRAGTRDSEKCTLILTEGDSAKALAVAGLSVVGRELFGVFPLKGKLLNVRDVSLKKISSNSEISNIMKILGLSFNMYPKKATEEERIVIMKKKLRYGRILIFTDQDVDGSHIKGLVINFFHSLWPILLKLNTFIISLATPIVKVSKGKKVESFYTLTEYENWEKLDKKGWKTKYYKGLGTSTSKEAKEYFQDFENNKINYIHSITDETSDDSIKMAFAKENADLRKEWLKSYNKEEIIEQSNKKVNYSDFINKDLIHFSNYDCQRSIPSMIDGLKPSWRKILFAVMKKPNNNESKVSQLAGYISEKSAYHHGEASLYTSIIGMAQDYVGSNNINLLNPNGQFGTRLEGGKDAGAPRYIWTNLNNLTKLIYHPDDSPLLRYNLDDGKEVEPEWYVPIIPMILINGTRGIGTGFNTAVPSHNPLDIIDNIYSLMKNDRFIGMKPWFKNFKGTLKFKDISKYNCKIYDTCGVYKKINDKTLEISELPIGMWIEKYKTFLESVIYDKTVPKKQQDKQCIIGFKSYSTESMVKFILTFRKGELDEFIENREIIKLLKLTDSRNSSYSNMHLYNRKGSITKYDDTEKIMRDFYKIRIEFYIKRKKYLLNKYDEEIKETSAKINFINEFINKTIDIINEEDDKIYEQLKQKEYPILDNDDKYNYLLNMSLRTLTKKKMDELLKNNDIKIKIRNTLASKSSKELWKTDLSKFVKEYKKKI